METTLQRRRVLPPSLQLRRVIPLLVLVRKATKQSINKPTRSEETTRAGVVQVRSLRDATIRKWDKSVYPSGVLTKEGHYPQES